jgi:thiosulfate/3-mercaptopyruvate sulfurtransferase
MMRQLFFLLLGLGLLPLAQADAPAPVAKPAAAISPLMTPETLSQALEHRPGQWRIVDIRDPVSFEDQHVPGALNLPFNAWRGPENNPGGVPALSVWLQLIDQLALGPQQPVAVMAYGTDAADFGASARVYWTLKSLGVQRLAIVQGGFSAWELAGLPTQSGPALVPPPPQRRLVPQLRNDWLATTPQVLAHIQRHDAQLFDARTEAFYKGLTRVPAAKAAGTLPQALLLDSTRWFTPGSNASPNPQRITQWAQQQALPSGATVVFCNTGHLAATNWFVLSEWLGWSQVKLYPGSMVEWTQHQTALPLSNEPRRWSQLWLDAQLWYQQRFQ